MTHDPRRIVLVHRQAPGDTLVLTAVVRDLAAAHPGRFELYADTTAPELWDGNPHIRFDRHLLQGHQPDVQYVTTDYGAAAARGRSSERTHFIAGYHADLAAKLGVDIPHGPPEPQLFLTPREQTPYDDLPPRYWVVNAGCKQDAPVKVSPTRTIQAVVDHLADLGIACVQAGTRQTVGRVDHWQPTLARTIDWVDRTDVRGLVRLIAHADGVITPISFPMHLAAALGRPCVVLAGAREAWHWEAYDRRNPGLPNPDQLRVDHRYLHANGLMPCHNSEFGGCWVNKVLFAPGQRCCQLPEEVNGQWVARCLLMVRPEEVIASVLSYYDDGTLTAPPSVDLSTYFADADDGVEASAWPPPIGGPLIYRRAGGRPGVVRVPLETPTVDPSAPVRRKPPSPRGETMIGAVWTPRETPIPIGADPDFDDPVVGGKFTVFTLLYGDYVDMHQRGLGSLTSTLALEPGRSELRVVSNALGAESRRYVASLRDRGLVDHWTDHRDNRLKYVAMRQAFRDPERPIATPYLIWADDDTMFDVDQRWLRCLSREIIQRHPGGCRLYGPPYYYSLAPAQLAWYRQSTANRGVAFQDRHGNDNPNGTGVWFASGGFWALETATMIAGDIPDARLRHNGGDVWIGWAVRQQGGSLSPFAGGKSVVRWSAFKRRGYSEPHPGLA